MTFYIIKNIRYKCIIAFFVLLLAFFTLIMFEGLGGVMAFRTIFGGNILFRPMVVVSFVLCMAVLQFLHADGILMILKNDTYLSVRHLSRKNLFGKLLMNMIVTNVVFLVIAICALVAAITIDTISIGGTISIPITLLVKVGLRAYLACNFFSLIQSIILVTKGETNALIGMTVLSIVFVVLSQLDVAVYNICPFELAKSDISKNVIISVIYNIAGIYIYWIKYKNREVGRIC